MPTLTSSLEDLHPLGSLLPLATVVSYLTVIASELQNAHARGVVHGAVSPANIMLSNGTIVVSNFGGIAQPAFMAPEQFIGEATPASDQYALGILVYQWLSGTLPFQGNDLEDQHRSAPVPSLKKRLPTIPGRVERVVLKALAKDPLNRYPTVEAFAHAFEQAVLTAASRPSVHPASGQALPSSPLSGIRRRHSPNQAIFSRLRDNRVLVLYACCFVAAMIVMMIGWLAGEVFFPPKPVEIPTVQFHPSQPAHHLTMIVPSPTPTSVLQTTPFTLSASVTSQNSSLDGITLDTYTNENITHDLTQQESDGMILMFTNISSPCQDVTFPVGQITDSVGNIIQIQEDIKLPCSAPTASIKVSTEQYTQTGTFPANGLYSISEQLSVLSEDPTSVLSRMMVEQEQSAAAQFSNDATNRYPSLQFQEQDMLCVHTDPDIGNGSLTIMKEACATFLIDPSQLPLAVLRVEQEHNPAAQSCTVETATLDTHNSFITFDGMFNPIISLSMTLKGTCKVLI